MAPPLTCMIPRSTSAGPAIEGDEACDASRVPFAVGQGAQLEQPDREPIDAECEEMREKQDSDKERVREQAL
jgi:hypothetical protein